jgi:hypothetical protein
MTIKMFPPKAYGEILPLADSQEQPIRPRPAWLSTIVAPEIKDRPNCNECQTHACRTGRCDWNDEVQP